MVRVRRYTPDEVRQMLNKKAQPSRREWARVNNVRTGHLSEFMSGKRGPCSDLLDALGLEYAIVRKDHSNGNQ